MARLLLEYGAEIESREFGQQTALHIASSYPKLSLVRLMLAYDARIDAQNSDGHTPLFLASGGDSKSGAFVHSVKLLLREGAKTDITSDEGQTALYKASGKGRDDIVQLLLRYGANPDRGRGRHGETTLFKAVWLNEFEIVNMLLLYGADVNLANRSKMKTYRGLGERMLHGVLAAVSNDHAILNQWGRTALHGAAYQGSSEILQTLLDAGADTELRGTDNLTALYVAAGQNRESIVQQLLKAGAKLDSTHDPVMALLEKRNQGRVGDGGKQEVVWRSGLQTHMDRIGTNDMVVGLVSGFAKTLAASRRGEASGVIRRLGITRGNDEASSLSTNLLQSFLPPSQDRESGGAPG